MVHLERGRTTSDPGLCFVSYLRQIARDEHGTKDDWCPVLLRFLQTFNDILMDGERQSLLHHADASLLGLQTASAAIRRVEEAAEWLVSRHCSHWVRLLGRDEIANQLHRVRFGASDHEVDVDEQLGAARLAVLENLGEYTTAEAAVEARSLMNRSGATAAAAALAPMLEEHFTEASHLGLTLQRGWEGWRLGWDISEILVQADPEGERIRTFHGHTDEMRVDVWRLMMQMLKPSDSELRSA